MKTLWLLQYNNYYNRIVKREETLADYQVYQVKFKGSMQDPNGNTAVLQNVNFIEGDFVNTTQVVNWGGDLPDYVLVIDENQQIESRWFVVSSEKTRGGQLSLRLHRDLVVDFYDNIIDADCFIEKATLNSNDPLIFNSEDMTFNQIKQSELMLTDETKCSWIVFYSDQKTELKANIIYNQNVYATYTEAEWENSFIRLAALRNTKICDPNTLSYFYWRIRVGYWDSPWVAWYKFYPNYTVEELSPVSDSTMYPSALKVNVTHTNGGSALILRGISGGGYGNAWETLVNEKGIAFADGGNFFQIDSTKYQNIKEAANNIIRVTGSSGDIFYKIIATPLHYAGTADYRGQTVWNIIKNNGYAQGGYLMPSQQPYNIANDLYFNCAAYAVSLEPINPAQINVDLPGNAKTNDTPYNIWAMPYSDILTIQNSLDSSFPAFTSNKSMNMRIIKELIIQYAGAGAIYDAQILPYCPLTNFSVTETGIDLRTASNNNYRLILDENANIVSCIMAAECSSFNRVIEIDPIQSENPKIESLTDLWRLSSPNFNGMFEFSVAKNGGIDNFIVSATYKPFSPYVKVRPGFKGLYGADFDDSRGLILGGDFSLPMTTDAWATYEMQNKNYQNMFDRQIQNMDVKNNIARQQEKWAVAAGVVQGVTSGGITGSAFGGIGAAVGAVIGGGAALTGGLMDIKYNERLRREEMSLTKDQYGYSLGNIQALPSSLTKTSAYNIDNKYFPFLEFFTCSDTEKLALAQKIAYNGMTAMVIGKIKNYINNQWEYEKPNGTTITSHGYIKGKLIRLEGIAVDAHIINAIADELFEGVFI